LNVIKSVVENSVRASIKNLTKELLKEHQKVEADKFNETDDIDEAARILKGHKKGRGDVQVFLDNLNRKKSVKTLDKIKLICEGEYNKDMLYCDKNAKKANEIQKGLSQKKIFNLWRYCVRKQNLIKEDEFFGYFNEYQHKKVWWGNYFDADGETIIKQDEATRASRRGKKAKWRKRRAQQKMQN
jgi:hypothetical protein